MTAAQAGPVTRTIAVGLPVRSGRVLVSCGWDSVKDQAFYRALGGGVEPGETAVEALHREFAEELGVRLDDARPLAVVEDEFLFEGTPHREVAHVFALRSRDIDAIPLDSQRTVLDEGSPVVWVRIDALDRPLYPVGAVPLLTALGRSAH